ncbi:hypothetical protein KIW84_053715 [Lathyrus oleraceus]|uniref:Transposase-associated domain-containing protein n=1 Tax=Pisum sativum TaxID=3888 RepID=A0A9D4WTQ8_PEA|nr:hypothetical protein KIW84_053715 [Pisum sativum]
MYDRTYPGRRGLKPNFEEGVKGFITWAFAQECCLSEGGVRCPCLKCECRPIISDPEEVERHLKRRGFIKNYWVWTYNGEQTGDRTLFNRVASGEGTSRPTQLTPEMMETVRQLALTEARRETAEREAALKAELEEMKKRQHDMEEQMRQFMQSMSRNQNQRTTEDDEDDDEFDV